MQYGLEPPWQLAPAAQVTRGVQVVPIHCSSTLPLHCHALSEQVEGEAVAWAVDALVSIVVGIADRAEGCAVAVAELPDPEETNPEELPSKS